MINEEKKRIQDEAFNALKQSGFNGAALIATGVGKAKLLIDVIKHLKPKSILYLCDSQDNRDKTFPNQILEWGEPWMFEATEMHCYQTAYKFKNKEYDLLLADEVDYSLTPAYSKVYKNNKFKHKVLVTATCSDDKLKLLNKIAPVVYKKIAKDAESEGALNKAKYYFVNYDLSPQENKRYVYYNNRFIELLNKDKPNSFLLQRLQLSRKRFLENLESSREVVKSLLTVLHKNEKNKILIFCGSTDQADSITKYSYHSKSEQDYLTKFNDGKIRVLSVVGKIDRGVNLVGVNNVIFESTTGSVTKTSQRTGRARRLKTDDYAHIYFLVPMFKSTYGEKRPTIVQKWILDSSKDLDLSGVKYIRYEQKSKTLFS